MKKRLILLALLLALVCGLCGCAGQENPFEGIPNPIATIEMRDGSTMRFELFLQEAPNTVANFVELANSGFYNGKDFFRIIPGALIQSGAPQNSRSGNAGHAIQGEFAQNGIENDLSHTRGTISMSRQEEFNTASSQFFIMQGNYPEYDGRYAAFGRAMDAESLAVIDSIASTPVDSNYTPLGTMSRIKTITVETHGYDYEAAKMKLPEKDEK